MNDFPLTQALAEGQAAQHAHDEPRDYLGLSGIGGCRRQAAYRLYHPGDDVPDELTQRLFDDGHLHEDMLIQQLEAGGVEIRHPQRTVTWPFEGFERVQGHIEGLATLPSGEVVLLEIKSMRGFAFSKIKKFEGDGPCIPTLWPHYYAQVQAYLHGLAQRPDTGDVTRAIWVVKCRDDGAVYEESTRYDVSYANQLVDYWRPLVAAVAAGRTPPADFIPGQHWGCRKQYCSFAERCRKDT